MAHPAKLSYAVFYVLAVLVFLARLSSASTHTVIIDPISDRIYKATHTEQDDIDVANEDVSMHHVEDGMDRAEQMWKNPSDEYLRHRWATLIYVINATPNDWVLTYSHSYQMKDWEFWPDIIRSGESVAVLANRQGPGNLKDSAGEVIYEVQNTPEPMAMEIGYRSMDKETERHSVSASYRDHMSSRDTLPGGLVYLGHVPIPGGVLWGLAGGYDSLISPGMKTSRWMQSQWHILKDKTLRQIPLPRSIASGMHKATKLLGGATVAEVRYQQEDLAEQLRLGIRVIEFHPMKHNGEWWASTGKLDGDRYRGALGESLASMRDAVNRFVSEHERELIIWDVRGDETHGGRVGEGEDNWAPLDDALRQELYRELRGFERRLRVPDDEDVSKMTLQDVVSPGYGGVMFLFGDSFAQAAGFPGGKDGFVSKANFPVGRITTSTSKARVFENSLKAAIMEERRTADSHILAYDSFMIPAARDPKRSYIEESRTAWSLLYMEYWDMIGSDSYPNWLGMAGVHSKTQTWLCMAIVECFLGKRCGDLNGKVPVALEGLSRNETRLQG